MKTRTKKKNGSDQEQYAAYPHTKKSWDIIKSVLAELIVYGAIAFMVIRTFIAAVFG